MSHREFKDRVFAEFGRIGQALASARRLELLDLLAQAPRNVEALARETEQPVANVSQHLQVLSRAGLVERERAGTRVSYRLAQGVLELWLRLRDLAEARLPELRYIMEEQAAPGEAGEPVTRSELNALLKASDVVLIDVRPPIEYEYGHLPGARAIPLEELPERLDELPREKRIVVYCRGAYYLLADEAVALLRRRGYQAQRIEGGWAEWLSERRPVECASAAM